MTPSTSVMDASTARSMSHGAVGGGGSEPHPLIGTATSPGRSRLKTAASPTALRKIGSFYFVAHNKPRSDVLLVFGGYLV